MTEEEAFGQLNIKNSVNSLPKKFHTKEFVLKCYDIGVLITTVDLTMCGIKIDYDIILSRLINRQKLGIVLFMSKRSLTRIYSILSEQEIDKILMILKLIK